MPLLELEEVTVEFPAGRGRWVHAVSGVSFRLERGETLGIVGESGCGKSTLARAIMQLPPPTSGRIILDGIDLKTIGREELRQQRRRFQMIFQDPAASLNPLRPAGESIAAPLREMGGTDAAERRRRTQEMMLAVGLDPDRHSDRRPSRLSGGQCQRVCIARALMTGPELLICDEAVSSLDVSIQAQILNLLKEIRVSRGLGMLFIAHDLAVVRHICDRVAVMYLGRLCESAPCASLYLAPAHPYTRALLDVVPRPDPGWVPVAGGMLPGELPSAVYPPSGCRFRTRCPRAAEHCVAEVPELREIGPGHLVACHFPLSPSAVAATTPLRTTLQPEGGNTPIAS
jgi:peptide/nickel transport system ATP-binding protein